MARDSQFAKMRKKLKYKIRIRNRCRLCGRPRGYLRKFQMCRIYFRAHALRAPARPMAAPRRDSWRGPHAP